MAHPEPHSARHSDVVVIGGGVAGLTAAAAAAACGVSVTVLERQELGGRASTDTVGRFRFNRGAHALYRGAPAHGVLARLEVEVSAASPPGTDAHGLLGDVVEVLPWGDDALARTLLIHQDDKVALDAFLRNLGDLDISRLGTQTASAWLDDLALPRSVRRFVETQIRLVTYVADLDTVSADLVATQLRLDPTVDYLHQGWSQLVGQIAATAERRGVHLHRGSTVRSVTADGTAVVVDTPTHRIHARAVVLATGTPAAAARLLGHLPARWSQLGPPLEVAALDLGITTMPSRRVLLGIDRPLYFSMHGPPAHLGPPEAAVVHLLRYLRPGEHLSADVARHEMLDHARLAGITTENIEESRYLHRMTVVGGLPLAEHGGLSSRPRVTDTDVAGVFVAGDWVGPEGHLADAALVSGEAAGRAAASRVLHQPTVADTA